MSEQLLPCIDLHFGKGYDRFASELAQAREFKQFLNEETPLYLVHKDVLVVLNLTK